MQVFKTFMKVLRRKLLPTLVYISLFIAISAAMTKYAAYENFTEVKLNICIFDEDATPESGQLAEFIGENHNIIPPVSDRDMLIDRLYYEDIDFAFIIKKGYSEKLAAGETDGLFESLDVHKSYSSSLMEQFLNEYITAVNSYKAGGAPLDEAIAMAREALSEKTEVSIAADENDHGYSMDFSEYFTYMPYILLSVMVSTLSPVLMSMNRKDIRSRTNCSSIKNTSYTVEIFLGSIIFVITVWLIFFITGIFLCGGLYQGRAWTAVLNSFIFAIISAAIAILLSLFDISINALNLINQMISLGMSFFCGIFVRQSLLGEGVLRAARFLPAYWYIKANDMLCGRELYSASQVTVCLLIEAAFAAAIIMPALLIRKIKRSGTAEM